MKRSSVSAGLCLAVLVACGSTVFAQGGKAAPTVFWASEPVRPGEAAMAIGEDFGDKPSVEIVQLPNGRAGAPTKEAFAWPKRGTAVEALQANAQSVKFTVPTSFGPGLFAVRMATRDGVAVRVLNRPQVWWAQGDGGSTATPGGWIRAFGKNLGWEAKRRTT